MSPTHKSRGFTLAEVLIATAITLLVVTLLFGVFSSVVSQWRSSDQRIDAFRDARAALLLITRDLSRAHVNGDRQMITLVDDTGTYAKEAYMVTPIPNAGKSELCAVGYYCAWDSVAKTFTLKRLFRDSDAAVTSLQGPTVNFTTLYSKVAANEENLAACVWDLQFAPGIDADPEPPSLKSVHKMALDRSPV